MTNLIETAQLLCGFLIIFFGVYMLNYPSKDLDSHEFQSIASSLVPDSPTTGLMRTRLSMQGLRPSSDRRSYEAEEEEGFVLQSLSRRSEDGRAVRENR